MGSLLSGVKAKDRVIKLPHSAHPTKVSKRKTPEAVDELSVLEVDFTPQQKPHRRFILKIQTHFARQSPSVPGSPGTHLDV